ncbi:hypothetical protein K503DRAFT_119732 [Rhizopogon vinicolor AM-OR11-026]|uniref:Uncharacterized protein n=1 Tax=Rhizopogon vinicolor AM-OR11-026 TaxID=1314800 RepID=A0A1B7N279_9AGAM|nr:hypothetical protein K503DRAFT_119732 [Rhizopogon vinicolor AM-OR11-026]
MVYPERRHDCRVRVRTLRQRLCSAWRLLSPHLTVLAPCSSRLEPAVFSFSFPRPPLPYPSLSLGSSQPTFITIFLRYLLLLVVLPGFFATATYIL